MRISHVLSTVLCCMTVIFSGVAMAIEEPKYTVLAKDGDFELREYAPMVIAEVIVDGDMSEAGSKGFKLIAGYIFGDNTSRKSATKPQVDSEKQGKGEKIAMTAPVTMAAKSEKISMTAPVTMAPTAGQWRMHFVMPGQYTMDILPTPNNQQVVLRELPAKKFAVLRFSGLTGTNKIAKKAQALQVWMATKNVVPIGGFSLARYNPPWSLPFLRRNEVMVPFN